VVPIWVLTPDGFFSAIAFDPKRGKADLKQIPAAPEDTLIIRSRVQADIEHLTATLAEDGYDVPWWRDLGADYMFRAFVTREQWSAYLTRAVEDMEYGNFKDEVTKRQGKKRHDVYMRVWSALLSLQPSGSTWGRRATRISARTQNTRLPLPEPTNSDEEFLRWLETEDDDARLGSLISMTDAEFAAYEAGLN